MDLSALVPAPTAGLAGPVAAAAGDCQALVNYAVLGISGAVACAAVVIENLQKVGGCSCAGLDNLQSCGSSLVYHQCIECGTRDAMTMPRSANAAYEGGACKL